MSYEEDREANAVNEENYDPEVYVHAVQHASAEDLELARMCAASRERKAWLLLQEAEKHLARCIEHWNNAQTELFSYGPQN